MKFGKKIKLDKPIYRIRFAFFPTQMSNNTYVWLEKYQDYGYYFYGQITEQVYWMTIERKSL